MVTFHLKYSLTCYSLIRYSLIWAVLSSHLAKMDHRIGIFVLKLVCVENFKLFGLADSELTHFQDLAFPEHFNGICCC